MQVMACPIEVMRYFCVCRSESSHSTGSPDSRCSAWRLGSAFRALLQPPWSLQSVCTLFYGPLLGRSSTSGRRPDLMCLSAGDACIQVGCGSDGRMPRPNVVETTSRHLATKPWNTEIAARVVSVRTEPGQLEGRFRYHADPPRW